MTVDIQLDADDGTDPGAFCFQAESNDAADVGVIGYPYAMVSELRCFSCQCFGGDGAVAEGKSSMRAELDGHTLYVAPNKPRSKAVAVMRSLPPFQQPSAISISFTFASSGAVSVSYTHLRA